MSSLPIPYKATKEGPFSTGEFARSRASGGARRRHSHTATLSSCTMYSRRVCAALPTGTPLDQMSTHQFNDQRMKAMLPRDVWERFRDARDKGDDVSGDDMQAIAECMFHWATGLGAVNFAHIFYPARSTGAQLGGAAGMKHDAFVELDHGAPSAIKPIVLSFEGKRLFTGETDGSSFPNGGLRATHTAAGFTSWDRSSAPWVYLDSLYIPCVLVSHYGDAIDEKTPLLRASDAIQRESLRLMQHTGFETESTKVTINMGCEQGEEILSASFV